MRACYSPDGAAWMAMYALNLLRISLELALHRMVFEDIATKFLQHFLEIAGAMRNAGGHEMELWNEEEGFFYMVLHNDSSSAAICESLPLRIRSLVRLIPLFAVETLSSDLIERRGPIRMPVNYLLAGTTYFFTSISMATMTAAHVRRTRPAGRK